MFTGIIQNTGKVVSMKSSGGQTAVKIRFVKKENKIPKLGESIAVNGVCLTVRKTDGKKFEADVVRETLAATNLSKLKAGSSVNLERSLKLGDELSGHFVTGHVDNCARILKIARSGKNISISISAPEKVRPYLAPKGSITVDGISLTVQMVEAGSFRVAIVPHTLKHTTLPLKKAGDWVNLEVDLIARYMKVLSEVISTCRILAGRNPDATLFKGCKKPVGSLAPAKGAGPRDDRKIRKLKRQGF